MANEKAREMSVDRAMTIAVVGWGALLMCLLILMGIAVALTLAGVGAVAVDGWLVSAMLVVAVLPTVAAFLHRYLFHHRRTERGTVTPSGYLQASFTLWGAIAAAGVWGIFATLMAGAMIPHIIPVFIAMFLLLGTWPNGKAMVKPRSLESEDDTEILHIPPGDE